MKASAWKLIALCTAGSALLLAGCGSIADDPGNEMDQQQNSASLAAKSNTAESNSAESSTAEASTTNSTKAQSPTPAPNASADSPQPLGTPSLEDRTLYPESGSQLTPKSIRTAHHSGAHGTFDRVTIEFDGTGPAGWYTHWTDQPAQQASGHPIPFSGTTALDLGVEMTPYPIDDPAAQAKMLDTKSYPGTTEHGGIITEVNYNNAFEARSQFIIGLTQQAPYSLTYLDGPPRVVIDFQTS